MTDLFNRRPSKPCGLCGKPKDLRAYKDGSMLFAMLCRFCDLGHSQQIESD